MSTDRGSFSLQLPSQHLNSTTHNSNRLPLVPQVDEHADLYLFLRGPCYKAYSELRDSRLRKKYREHRQGEPIRLVPAVATPPRKQVKFHDLAATRDQNLVRDVKVPRFVGSGWVRGRKVSSVVAQSVLDFSAALRKENRRPAAEITLTPPSAKKGSVGMGNGLSAKGSKSVSAAEKRGGGVAARKSYASVEELGVPSVRAAKAISGGIGDSRRRILGSRRL